MTWKTKALIQRIFSHIPNGAYLNYLCQRHITKGLPISYEKFLEGISLKVKNPLSIMTQHDEDIQTKTYFEFGAGWDLLAPIGMSLGGMGKIHIVDVRPLVRPALIQQTLRYYHQAIEAGGGGG